MPQFSINTKYDCAVGALVTIEIEGVKRVILQKRPLFKPDGKPESFPNGLDKTVRGRLDPIDRLGGKIKGSVLNGLKREVKEEVREMIDRGFSDEDFTKNRKNIAEGKVTSLVDSSVLTEAFITGGKILTVARETINSVRKTNVTLGFSIQENIGEVNDAFIPAIQELVKKGVIVLLSADEIGKLVPLNPKLHKDSGILEEGKYGMFQDEIDAVKKALGV